MERIIKVNNCVCVNLTNSGSPETTGRFLKKVERNVKPGNQSTLQHYYDCVIFDDKR